MPPLPRLDFCVIGAQKCATSWLYLCLRDHPGAWLPAKKDEANYLFGPRYRERGAAWFESLYPPRADAGVRGSVSVDYLFDRAALDATLEHYPAARFVACLRNPLDRSASAFHFLARKGLIPAREFNAGIEAALDAFAAPAPAPAQAADAELIARSLYAAQLEPFARRQAWGRLLVVGYERLCAEPQRTLREIYEFVGLPGDFSPPSFAQRPKVNANLPLLTALERLAPRSRLLAKTMDHANRLAARLRLARPPPAYHAQVERRLRAVFAPDVAALESRLAALPPPQVRFLKSPARDWGFADSSRGL